MSNIAIKVENLSKMYHLGSIGYGTLKDDLQSWWAKLRGKEDPNAMIGKANRLGKHGEFWALRDIDFQVLQGERIGIVGRNGAGKSTLLKILSRITAPSEGCIKIKGRIASLLEVGTGFHPELTGRENVYLNGAILGMKRQEIQRKFSEIVEFSEVGEFIDTPVKRYSSGMYVRLAFSVAAHLESDIMIVDEVLAVGDVSFQKKCLAKMTEISVGQGRTILYVSHNMTSVASLCDIGVLLEAGKQTYYGPMEAVIDRYSAQLQQSRNRMADIGASGSKKVHFISCKSMNSKGDSLKKYSIFEPIQIQLDFQVDEGVTGILVPNFHFKTAEGIQAFISSADSCTPLRRGLYRAVCIVPGNLLNEGGYSVGLAITEFKGKDYIVHFFEDDVVTLSVYDNFLDNSYRYGYDGLIPGIVRPKLEWKINPVTDS